MARARSHRTHDSVEAFRVVHSTDSAVDDHFIGGLGDRHVVPDVFLPTESDSVSTFG